MYQGKNSQDGFRKQSIHRVDNGCYSDHWNWNIYNLNPTKSSGKFISAFKEKAQHDRASEQCVDLGFDLVKPESAIENQEINEWILMNNFYLSFWLRTQQGTVARTSPSQTSPNMFRICWSGQPWDKVEIEILRKRKNLNIMIIFPMWRSYFHRILTMQFRWINSVGNLQSRNKNTALYANPVWLCFEIITFSHSLWIIDYTA